MDWSDVTRRVVVEAAAPHPKDVVLVLGDDPALVAALSPRVARVEVRALSAAAAPFPPGTSVVVLHDHLRRLRPADQEALLLDLGRRLPARALLVVGDVMWSMPKKDVDEPEQFGDAIEQAPTVAAVERWVRAAGFLPDVHRFGVGRAVCVALKG